MYPRAVSHFLDAILDKTPRITVALLAGRGHGKSAALGLAIAGAIAAGYFDFNALGRTYSHTIQRMMALYIPSHYKNSPNDLQLLADAPAHHLFVLLGTLFFCC